MPAHRLALPLSARLRLATRALARLPARGLHLAAVVRSRRRLALLDDRLLRDIGLTRAEAVTEVERPAWGAPSHWMD